MRLCDEVIEAALNFFKFTVDWRPLNSPTAEPCNEPSASNLSHLNAHIFSFKLFVFVFSRAYTENQRRVSVLFHNNAEMMEYPTDSQMSGRSGSESDDEQHLQGSRYHQHQRPNLSQYYVSVGGVPGTGGSGGDATGRFNGSSNGLNKINTVQLEPIVKSNEVVTDPAVRSQSILSNVETESSGIQ